MKKRSCIGRWQAAFILGAAAVGIAVPAMADQPFGPTKEEHWGVITRNTIGSAVGDLRDGPYGSFGVTGDAGEPPFGKGSLGLQVSDNALNDPVNPQEKVDFGNEVDFFGDPVLALTEVGFHVFQTGENAAISPRNMPNIRFEIDPNLAAGGDDYTTMVWVPDAAPVTNEWSGYIDATTTGNWYFTGAEGAATGCTEALTCDFAAAKTALMANNNGTPPIIYTVQVGKGRDNAWVGAVDGLRLNRTIFDFEEDGVKSKGVRGGHDDDDDDDDDD